MQSGSASLQRAVDVVIHLTVRVVIHLTGVALKLLTY